MTEQGTPPEAALTRLMDTRVGTGRGAPLADSGEHCRKVTEKFGGDQAQASQALATWFWWSLSRSPVFAEVVRRGFGRPVPAGTGVVVVRHAHQTRFSLLIVDHSYDGQPVAAGLLPDRAERLVRLRNEGRRTVSVSPRLLLDAVRREFGRTRNLAHGVPARGHGVDLRLLLGALTEICRRHQFGMLLLGTPPLRTTAGPADQTSSYGAKRPGIGVAFPGLAADGGSGRTSTTLGFVTTRGGRQVATSALHHGRVPARRIRATVAERPVRIIDSDPATDSCLIDLRTLPEPLAEFRPMAPPPVECLPAFGHNVHFHRRGREDSPPTTIAGYSPDVVLPSGRYPAETGPALVVTPDVTRAGDSGTALFDDHKRMLGFASARTVPEAEHDFSTWVWANHVLDRYGLTPDPAPAD